MSEIANHNGNEPWVSLESASWWFDKSSVVLAFSLFIGFVCTVTIIITGIAKEHHWDLLRERAAKETASVRLEAANANKAAGEAHARAADLEKKAAELTAANLALEAQIQLRRWDKKEDAIAFGTALSKFKGKVVKVSSQLADVEASILAQQIMFGLKQGGGIGVVDRRSTLAPLGIVAVGVLVSGKDQELVSAIIKALPPKLKADRGEMPANAMGLGVTDPPVEIDATILVGGKPLPDL